MRVNFRKSKGAPGVSEGAGPLAGVGAVLLDDGEEKAIAYTCSARQSYVKIEREALVKVFRAGPPTSSHTANIDPKHGCIVILLSDEQ